MISPYDARDFAFEPFEHQMERRAVSVAEMLGGTGSGGSAICSCGGWGTTVLDNRAGSEAARREFRDHVDAERRARIEKIAEMLGDVDLTQHPHDIQDTLAKAAQAIRQANCY